MKNREIDRKQVRKARKQGGYDGRILRHIPISSRRTRRELEREEEKEMKKRVLNLDDSIDEMINETLSRNQKEVNQEEEVNHEEEDLYGFKPNGERYKKTIKDRETGKKYYQRMKKNKNQREKRREEKRIRDENRPELERSIIESIREKKENRLKKQRDYSRSRRKKIKEENTMDITETIYFRLEDDGMGHLTLPSDLVNDLVKNREVNLSFTFHEDGGIFSDNKFGKVSIDYIPVGTEDKKGCCVGEMLVKKKIEFLTPEKENN